VTVCVVLREELRRRPAYGTHADRRGNADPGDQPPRQRHVGGRAKRHRRRTRRIGSTHDILRPTAIAASTALRSDSASMRRAEYAGPQHEPSACGRGHRLESPPRRRPRITARPAASALQQSSLTPWKLA
jgi:hypothetical protein